MEFAEVLKILEGVGLNAFLFYAWFIERRERMMLSDAIMDHLRNVTAHLRQG